MLGYGQQAGGTHPTGMHSCFKKIVFSRHSLFLKNDKTFTIKEKLNKQPPILSTNDEKSVSVVYESRVILINQG